MSILIEAGANLELTDNSRWTSCVAAIVACHVHVVEPLLDEGAALVSYSEGPDPEPTHAPAPSMALLGAEVNPRYPLSHMLRLLIRYRADPNLLELHRQSLWCSDDDVLAALQRSGWSHPSLPMFLRRVGSPSCVRLRWTLRRRPFACTSSCRPEPNPEPKRGAKRGCAAFVEHMLGAGVPPDRAFARGRVALTALHHAVVIGRADIVTLLVQRGADVEADRAGTLPGSPLFSCVGPNALECARFLLEAGADPNVRDAGGATPADRAAATGRAALAELLRNWRTK